MALSLGTESFVGRERELAELVSALTDAQNGSGQIVMIAGEPGIGKTRLTEELADIAQSKEFEVHWGRSYEDTGAPPYWPWTQIFRSYASTRDSDSIVGEMGESANVIADIFADLKAWDENMKPPPALGDPESARFRLFDSVSTFLARVSQEQPTLLIFDDAHWADAPTLQLLQFFARYVSDSRLIVVGTYRDTELSRRHPLSETLADLNRERVFTRTLLRGLAESEIHKLIEDLGVARPSSETTAEISSQTQGNPFFVKEIAYELANEDSTNQEIRIPEGVREVVGKRLNRISEDANELLRNAAIIGLEFDYRILDRLEAEQTEDEIIGWLEEAVTANLVENTSSIGGYRFAHALVRQTLLDEISPVIQVRRHARIADEIESLYGDTADEHAAELAYHFAEADMTGKSAKVVQYATTAGEQALAVHAPSHAAVQFTRALDALPVDASALQQAQLHYGLAQAMTQTSLRNELGLAGEQLELAFNGFIDAGEEKSAIQVALTYFPPVSRIGSLVNMLTRAIPLVENGSETHCLLLAKLIERSHFEGRPDPTHMANLIDEALDISANIGDDQLRLQVLMSSFMPITNEPPGEKLDRLAEEALPLIEDLGDDRAEFLIKEIFTDRLLANGEFDRAQQLARDAVAAARRTRNRFNIATGLSVLAGVELVGGNWLAADALIEEGLGIAPDETRLLTLQALSLAERGMSAESADLMNRAVVAAQAVPSNMGPVVWAIQCWALLNRLGGEKDFDRSLFTHLDEAQQEFSGKFYFVVETAIAAVGLADGDIDMVQSVLTEYEPLSDWFWRRGPQRCPHQFLAPALEMIGRREEAVESFEAGLEYSQKMGDRPAVVWLNTDYAELLLSRRDPGDVEQATTLRDEAVAIATKLEMKPHLEMLADISERLETAEVTSANSDNEYPDGLSEREMEVLSLIATGQSNQKIADELFLSRYTVVRHVANIFNKIGASNRVEATGYAHEHGLAGDSGER